MQYALLIYSDPNYKNSEEEMDELKKEIDELRRTIGYMASSLDHFMRAMSLEENPKEYGRINAFLGSLECLVDKNRIKVGSSIDDCLREIDKFTRIDAKENFPAGVPGFFPLYMDVLKNYVKNEKGKSPKTVRLNYYGCFPKEALEISFLDGIVTKIEKHVKTDCEVLLEELVQKHVEETAGKISLL